jgi:hypothetical protein
VVTIDADQSITFDSVSELLLQHARAISICSDASVRMGRLRRLRSGGIGLDRRLRLGLRDARAGRAGGLTRRRMLRLRCSLDFRAVPAVAHLHDQYRRADERYRQRDQRKPDPVDMRTLVHAVTIRGGRTEFRDQARAATHALHQERSSDGERI